MKNMSCIGCGRTCWVTDSTMNVVCNDCTEENFDNRVCEKCGTSVDKHTGDWQDPFWWCNDCLTDK